MDYDDNDISHHNLQLAGDSRSKSSAVLRPYDFPKFDFDDSLHTHLRFDNLVETEVFLGIQSHEDNQWIEDYSRGSNGMEFNSTPADSCSMSKRNNVWSEATSSESVEMLLKSVGQEEMMPGESIILDSNVSHEPSTLAKHVEPRSELEAANYGNPAEITLPQEKLHAAHLALKGHVEELLCDAEEPSVTHQNSETICLKRGTPTTEGKLPCHGEIQKEHETSAENPLIEARKDPLHFTGVDNINLVMPSTSEMSEQIANVSPKSCNVDGRRKSVCSGTEQEDSKVLEGMTDEASVHVHTVNSSVGLIVGSEVLKSQNVIKTSSECVEEITDMETGGESGLKTAELDGENVSPETLNMVKHEVKVLPLNNEMTVSFESCQDGSNKGGSDQHFAEVGSQNAGHREVPKKKIDSSVQVVYAQDIGDMKGAQASSPRGESTYEMPLVSADDKNPSSEGSDCIDTMNMSKTSEMVVLSSASEHSAAANEATENVVACHSDSLISSEKPDTQSPTAIIDKSNQDITRELSHKQANLPESELDICKTEEDKKPPNDVGIVEPVNIEVLTNDQITPSSDGNEGSREMNVVPNAKSSSSAEQGDDSENAKREPAVIGLSPSNNDDEKDATKLESGVNFETAEIESTKVEVTVADDAARSPQSNMEAKSVQTVDESNAASNSESPSVDAIKCLESTHSQVHIGGDKSSLEEMVGAEIVSCGNHDMTKMKLEVDKESAQAAEIDKASCGSPTIISSSEPSQMEKDSQEEIRGNEAPDQFVKSQPFSEELKRKGATGDDSSFTFKVNALPDISDQETGKTWSPFPNSEKCSSSVNVESSKISGESKTARTPTQKTPRQNVRKSDGEHVQGVSKGTSERKGRRVSAKGIAKESAKKGSQIKDTNTDGAKGEKVPSTLLNTSRSGTHVQFGKMQPHKHVEQSNAKLSGAAVPDLNNSALNNSNSPSASFRQPFSDMQQVQLRAQIFVYGSLIQGTAPDEACMVSAFGSSDGRNSWESVWRAAVERLRSQKSNSNAADTPLHPQSVARAMDANVKQGSNSSKVLSSPAVRASSKGTPASVVSPIIPLSSPLWSIATPSRDKFSTSGTHKGLGDYQHAVSPLHSYQTPPIRNFVGHTQWPSQPCFPGSWLASPQSSAFNTSVLLQPVTMTETVKLTPVRDSSGPPTSTMKHVTSSPVQSVGPSAVYVGPSLLPEPKVIVPAEGHSVDSKSRKRKKIQSSDPGKISLQSEVQIDPIVVSNAATILLPPVVSASSTPAPAFPSSDATMSKVATPVVVETSVDQPKVDNLDTGKVVTCSEETLSKVAEAKSQAEDAAALAAETVSRSEDLWRQLAEQKDSVRMSEVEAKLASAAAAISAAASVAKAAAAAAKVACNVALQAKLMADEAFHRSKMSALISSSGKYSADTHEIGNATPASILKGDDLISQSNSILLAAKEAAKRRVEAATAASKQAENLDAIVKAAELAAVAVSQAGKIVAMGEPLPLSELIEGHQDRPFSDLAEKPQDSNKEQSVATGMEDTVGTPSKGSRKDSGLKGRKTVGHGNIHAREGENDNTIDDNKNDARSGEDCEVSDAVKSIGVASDPGPSQDVDGTQDEHDELVDASLEDNIREGSAVEIYKRGNGLKSAWFSANVLTLKDGKVFVRYADLLSEEGSENLCEWVPLKSEGDQAPIIRSPHPITASQFQGTRKRRRAALGDYAWCVGDRVDVWIDDCWWEGVVTEKNEKDETTFKVHFPDRGETSTVRAWNLRTSRFWKDGKWVEWSSLKGINVSEQSDTPNEKRQKLGSPAVPTKGKDQLANDVDAVSGKPEESKLLDLSAGGRTFDVGKITSTKEENKRAVRRPLRTGQVKGGSGVIFGVPKPTGKKRKFMEVSKQFPTNISEKKNENDSVKFAKFLMPQAAQGFKFSSRNDSKEKRIAETRPRVPSSRKSSRTLPQRDNVNTTPAHHDELKDHHDGDMTEKLAHDSGESAEAPLSSLIAQTVSSSSKKVSSSNSRSERINRGKQASSVGKLTKIDEDNEHTGDTSKSVSDVAEPRRSNRRIQPTHRLLEGLQSSMVIPKMPSVSHDRTHRNPSRNVFSRGK